MTKYRLELCLGYRVIRIGLIDDLNNSNQMIKYVQIIKAELKLIRLFDKLLFNFLALVFKTSLF